MNNIIESYKSASMHNEVDRIKNIPKYFFEVCEAVYYLHSKKILNRSFREVKN